MKYDPKRKDSHRTAAEFKLKFTGRNFIFLNYPNPAVQRIEEHKGLMSFGGRVTKKLSFSRDVPICTVTYTNVTPIINN